MKKDYKHSDGLEWTVRLLSIIAMFLIIANSINGDSEESIPYIAGAILIVLFIFIYTGMSINLKIISKKLEEMNDKMKVQNDNDNEKEETDNKNVKG